MRRYYVYFNLTSLCLVIIVNIILLYVFFRFFVNLTYYIHLSPPLSRRNDMFHATILYFNYYYNYYHLKTRC